MQCLALIPGTSRSGATIIGGLFFGLSRKAATEFSFFLAIPIMFAATFYDVYRSRDILQFDDVGVFMLGLWPRSSARCWLCAGYCVLSVITILRFLHGTASDSESWSCSRPTPVRLNGQPPSLIIMDEAPGYGGALLNPVSRRPAAFQPPLVPRWPLASFSPSNPSRML